MGNRRKNFYRKRKPLANLSVVEEEKTYQVELPQDGMRADKFINSRTPWHSRTRTTEAFDEGRVFRNGVAIPAGRKLNVGDQIVLKLQAPHEDLDEMARIPYEMIFEDDEFFVVSKPPHLIVHPTGGYRYTTLLNALHLKYRNPDPKLDVVPRLVNRIDKETSGLVLCAKGRSMTGKLGTALTEKTVVKEYLALVEGCVEQDHQMIDLPIGQDNDAEVSMLRCIDQVNGQEAQTEVWTVERFSRFSLVRCRLHTGRMHQIRVHMKAIGHPLVCDHHYGIRDELLLSDITNADKPPSVIESPYGFRDGDTEVDVNERIRSVDTAKRHEYESLTQGKPVARGKDDQLVLGRCALHSHRLELIHPRSGDEIKLEAPLPGDMAGALGMLRAGK